MSALIFRFLYIGLFSIGGGLSAISLIQDEIVERLSWLTEDTLVDILAIAEMTPGPIAVNAASFVGMRLYGIPGAVLATCACILPGCIISFLISRMNEKLYKNDRWQNGLKLLRAAVVGIILSGSLVILKNALYGEGSELNLLSVGCFFIGLAAYRYWKPSPMLFMMCSGVCIGGLHSFVTQFFLG